jgi:hypothetical protein
MQDVNQTLNLIVKLDILDYTFHHRVRVIDRIINPGFAISSYARGTRLIVILKYPSQLNPFLMTSFAPAQYQKMHLFFDTT